MADILRDALGTDPRWRLDVCGDGSLADALQVRAAELGVSDRLVMHGHIGFGEPLWRLYRDSHALLHVSMTEGMPQVILEAFAARLPVVATAVGGVPEMVNGRGLLIAPSDAPAGATAVQRVLDDAGERAHNVQAGVDYVRRHTLQAESARLARFLKGDA